jgi:predicted RNA-binding Zn-ribbon protein involved in translation (DUF1610 family)
MTAIRRAPIACQNMNHRRANAPVAHCPQCGDAVNHAISRSECSAEQHAVARRQRSMFCVWCGEQLIVSRT